MGKVAEIKIIWVNLRSSEEREREKKLCAVMLIIFTVNVVLQ